MKSAGGKYYNTDAADTEQLLRIIQSSLGGPSFRRKPPFQAVFC
jgi:hypothetical protein